MTIVLLSAFIVGVESVLVEASINTFEIDSFVVAAVPSLIGGIVLFVCLPRPTMELVHSLKRRSWLLMLATTVLIAAGVLLWFDAVGRIGASKEAIIGGGSSEVLFIVLLSAAFLGERLTRAEIFGSLLVLIGVFMVLANVESLSLTFGLGELEAVVSSLLLAASVVFTTTLLRSHRLTPISCIELILSGAILVIVSIASGATAGLNAEKLLILAALGLLPAMGILTYNAGLPKIGASLTSVLFALVGIITIGIQLVVLATIPGSEMILPESLPMAIGGGFIAFVGVYLLNISPGSAHKAVDVS
jgi:drug/metabolite transporter (DMT)-like permease